jgi:peptidoglycan hydrolase-like protein with peptidoglycan-binding domain
VAGRKVNLFAIRAEGGKYASDVRGYILTWGNTVSCQLKPKDTYECRVVPGQINIAEEALRRGWVRTDPSAPVDYQKAQDYAQREQNGLWRNSRGSDSPSTPPVPVPQPNVASDRIGPSFPCTKATQPLALTICADPRLSRVDLMFVQAYQALRQQTGDAGSKSLRQEEADFHNKVLRECGIPDQGKAISDANVRNCIEQFYTNQRTAWISRLSGPTYQEATRALEQHIVLQRHLGQLGYLGSNLPTDGVYGPIMRRAISSWQRSRGTVETGILSDTDTLALERAVMNLNGEGTPPSQAQPTPQGGSVAVCGRTEWYSLDQTPGSDPRLRFRGVWTGKWNEGRVCAWLVVRSVNGDGSAEIEYAFVTVNGEKIAQSGRGQVQQDNLAFIDKEGTLLTFTLRLPSATSQISQLIGKFTDAEARTFDASFEKLT